jgi:hypothetical protein
MGGISDISTYSVIQRGTTEYMAAIMGKQVSLVMRECLNRVKTLPVMLGPPAAKERI